MLNWTDHAHQYQKRAAAHLWNSTSTMGAAALWLSPGYGKTTIVLHAFKALLDHGLAKNMLVVAPLRVIQTVWGQEVENWSSLHGIRTARLHGPKKEKWLARRDVNVWLINYEGLPWLADLAKKGKLPFGFDVIVFDEVRRMKNAQGKRFKATHPLAALAKYRWGLTGTPVSNGLMDLFGQFLILDNGKALGDRITRFRHDFFEKGYDGFSWEPRPGAQEAIESRIEPYIFRADGHLDLPDFIYDNRTVTLTPEARKTYNAMKRDLITQLEDTVITAANAAVLMGKLKQMANGRVYGENREVHEIHGAKKEALEELLEELGDEQLLIAYEYNHDLAQIRDILGEDLPYLGAGVNEKTMMDTVDRWNSGEIRVMAAHPASAGHGLNLQKGGAHHILWWGPTFDLDHYIQFNDRLRRQGNTADAVVVHTFVTEQSVDETAVKARDEKETLQDAVLKALTAEFGDSITLDRETHEENTMTDLTFKSDAAQQQAPANPFAPQAQAAPAPAANPFAQAAPAPQQEAATQPANPFAQAAPAPQQEQAPQPVGAPANPFAQGGAAGQVQAIQQDVAAQPVQRPAPANPFAAAPQPIEDAQVVQETPPAQDTGWTEPKPQPAVAPGPDGKLQNVMADMPKTDLPTSAPAGMVPLYVFVPADKLDKVFSAIGRAVK